MKMFCSQYRRPLGEMGQSTKSTNCTNSIKSAEGFLLISMGCIIQISLPMSPSIEKLHKRIFVFDKMGHGDLVLSSKLILGSNICKAALHAFPQLVLSGGRGGPLNRESSLKHICFWQNMRFGAFVLPSILMLRANICKVALSCPLATGTVWGSGAHKWRNFTKTYLFLKKYRVGNFWSV